MRGRAVIAAVALCAPMPAFAQAECYRDSITQPSPFMGNSGEIFIAAGSGTIWQVGPSYEYLYEYYPAVIICPASGLLLLKEKKIYITFLGKLAPRKPQ